MNWDNRLGRLIEYSFYLLIFTVPLIFLPGHLELFQFNKMIVVYLLAIIIGACWLLRMVVRGKFFIKTSPLDLPILLFLSSQIISTILSIEPHTSIWGYYSRFHGGLLSTVAYIVLFYAFISNSQREKKAKEKPLSSKWVSRGILVLLASVTTVSLYGILEHFGIDENYWVQDVRNRVFSTQGQPNWLAALLVLTAPLIFSFSFPSAALKLKRQRLSQISFLLFLIFFLTLLFTKSRSGFLGFWLMLLSYWLLLNSFFLPKLSKAFLLSLRLKSLSPLKSILVESEAEEKKTSGSNPMKANHNFLYFLLLSFLVMFLVGTPFTPNFKEIAAKLEKTIASGSAEINQVKPPAGGGTPSEDIRKIVWKGALEVWRHHPFFGSGVETFAYSYYNHRPLEHNYVSEWDFLYNKAHNEYLNFLANTGSFGLFAYLFLQFSFLNFCFKAYRETNQLLYLSLLSGYLGLSVVNFFGFSTVTDALISYLYYAFAVELRSLDKLPVSKLIGTKSGEKLSWIGWLTAITIVILGLSAFAEISVRWYADRLLAKGQDLAAGANLSQGLVLQQQAVSLVPDEPVFHDQLSLEFARSAASLYLDGSTASAELLASSSAWHSDMVMAINPFHINYLKNRAAAMLHLSIINPSYRETALQALLRAQSLSPTDPKLPFNLGLLFLDKGDTEKAVQLFQDSINLKNDYAPPHLELAAIYENLGQSENAIKEYEYILENIEPNNSQSKLALERLQTIPTPE